MGKTKLKKEGVILEPRGDIGAIFNSGACYDGEKVYLLPRVVKKGYYKEKGSFKNYISEIWLARSTDLKRFDLKGCFLKPDKDYDALGCEDPRVVRFNGSYIITYTALSKEKYRIGLASTNDFVNAIKYGIIGPDIKNKDAVIFPEKIKGKIAVLHRIEPDIQIMYFDDFEALKENKTSVSWEEYMNNLDDYIVLRGKEPWESKKLGAGTPPIKTDKGWLLIYHGVDENNIYRAGAALLDFDNPRKVIARSKEPILEPDSYYEQEGDVKNVVFPQGAIVKNNILHVFYGAADKRCCLATIPLEELVNSLEKN